MKKNLHGWHSVNSKTYSIIPARQKYKNFIRTLQNSNEITIFLWSESYRIDSWSYRISPYLWIWLKNLRRLEKILLEKKCHGKLNFGQEKKFRNLEMKITPHPMTRNVSLVPSGNENFVAESSIRLWCKKDVEERFLLLLLPTKTIRLLQPTVKTKVN